MSPPESLEKAGTTSEYLSWMGNSRSGVCETDHTVKSLTAPFPRYFITLPHKPTKKRMIGQTVHVNSLALSLPSIGFNIHIDKTMGH